MAKRKAKVKRTGAKVSSTAMTNLKKGMSAGAAMNCPPMVSQITPAPTVSSGQQVRMPKTKK